MKTTNRHHRLARLTLAALLATIPSVLGAYTICVEFPMSEGGCTTRCSFYDNETQQYRGHLEYGWCN